MMDPVQRRQYGRAALVLSAVLLTVSVGSGVATAMRRSAVVKEIAGSGEECEGRLKQLGAVSIERTPDQIVAHWASLEGGYTELGSSSAAALACPGWVMKSYCMGQECQPQGVKLELGRSTAS